MATGKTISYGGIIAPPSLRRGVGYCPKSRYIAALRQVKSFARSRARPQRVRLCRSYADMLELAALPGETVQRLNLYVHLSDAQSPRR